MKIYKVHLCLKLVIVRLKDYALKEYKQKHLGKTNYSPPTAASTDHPA